MDSHIDWKLRTKMIEKAIDFENYDAIRIILNKCWYIDIKNYNPTEDMLLQKLNKMDKPLQIPIANILKNVGYYNVLFEKLLEFIRNNYKNNNENSSFFINSNLDMESTYLNMIQYFIKNVEQSTKYPIKSYMLQNLPINIQTFVNDTLFR